MEYLYIAIALGPIIIQNGCIWHSSIYGSNRTVWHLNSVQKIKLFDIELFDYLKMCKQINGI